MPDDSLLTYDQILTSIWSDLREGANHGAHPFHTPVFATAAGDDPDVRTVVLRHVDEAQRQIFCHTDVRSPKVSVLQRNPRVAWLFYDRPAKVQLRLYGEVSVHCADAIAKARWEKSTSSSRLCYLAADAPGISLSVADRRSPAVKDGFDNFAVIACRVSAIDWLFLRAAGHQRVRFDLAEGGWNGKWIAP